MGYSVGLVGEAHCQEAIGGCREGQPVEVLHETGNPYDKKALVVKTKGGAKLGYIPKSSWLREALHDEEKGCSARIAQLNSGEAGSGVVIDVNLNQEGIEQCTYRP